MKPDARRRWINDQGGEDAIKTNPYCAFYYAFYVIKGRWLEGEDVIKTDPQWAYEYARCVIKDENFWEKREEELTNIKNDLILNDLILNDPLKSINDIHQSRVEYERERIEAEKKREQERIEAEKKREQERIEAEKKREQERIEAEKEKEREEQIRLQNIKNKHQNLNDWLSKIQSLINEHNIDIGSLIPNQENDFDEIDVKKKIVEYVADHIPIIV